MTHYVDLKLVYDHKYMKTMFGQSCPDRYILKECADNKGQYWRCIAAFGIRNDDDFAHYANVYTTDTFDEVAVWCDLHSIKLHHIEHLRNQQCLHKRL